MVLLKEDEYKGMIRNRHLFRSIADCSWGMLLNLLAYKAEEAGHNLIKVTPIGTSQICSGCGEKEKGGVKHLVADMMAMTGIPIMIGDNSKSRITLKLFKTGSLTEYPISFGIT